MWKLTEEVSDINETNSNILLQTKKLAEPDDDSNILLQTKKLSEPDDDETI